MIRFLLLAALSSAALAQTVPPPIPNIDAARAAARQVDQATQVPRTGKESMDRVTPLLTVEPHEEPSKEDDDAWRKTREAEAKKKLEASKPK
jgi:hypothetical protein